MSPFARVSSTSSDASASVVDSGLSQMTSIPASRKAFATGKCRWFGVTMTTASTPSGTRRLAGRHFAIVRVGPLRRKPKVGA